MPSGTSIGGLFLTLSADNAPLNASLQQSTKQLQQFHNVLDKGTRAAVQNFTFQLNDVTSGLLSGQSPFRILVQQGGQFVQAFQQGGGVMPVLRGFGTQLASLVTPGRVFVAGIAGITAGVTALAIRTENSIESARQFDIVLKGLGQGSITTGANLEKATRQLREFGLSATDARKELTAVIRSGLSGGRAGDIVAAGKNAEVLLGEGGTKALTDALAGGLESTIKFGLQLNAFTREEINAWREMARLGKGTDALSAAFDKISEKVKGLDKDALTPAAAAMRNLRLVWGETLDSLSNTNIIQNVTSILEAIGRGLGYISTGPLHAPGKKYGDAAYAPIPPGITGPVAGGKLSNLDAATLVKAVIAVESGGNPNAVSSAGAVGLMQLMPGTAAQMGVVNRFNPKENVIGGTRYLQNLLQHYDGDVEKALMAYNWGPGNLDRALAAGRSPPSGVTGYAKAVLSKYDALTGASGGSGSASAGNAVLPPNLTEQATDIDKIIRERERQVEVLEAVGAASEVVRAIQEAETITAEKRLTADQQARLEAGLINNVYKERLAQQNKVIQLTEDEITGIRDVTAALKQGAFAGTEAESNARAAAEGFQLYGTRSGGPYNAYVNTRSTQLTNRAQSLGLQGFANQNISDQQQAESLRLQASLVMETTETIDRQVALLKVRQQVEALGLNTQSEEVQARLKEVNALADANDLLAQRNREMERFREIGSSLEGSFSTIFDTIADGTFKVRDALKTILKDLSKTLFSQGFRALLNGESSGGTGTGLWGLFGKALGIGGGGLGSDDFGGGSDLAFASGGSFRVGGAGAIDSKVVAFRTSPGEMVDVRKNTFANSGGSGEVIRLELNHSDAFVNDIADQRVRLRSGQIVDVAVKRSRADTRRNVDAYGTEAQVRRG